MKKICLVVAVIAAFITMFGCSGSRENNSATESTGADPSIPLSSVAALADRDSSRKFIRSSEIKFRVKDVAQATYQIEDITRSFGGFVTHTHLESITEAKSISKISADSSVESIRYSVQNNMTLRVPNTKLDSTLKAIAALVDYLDYRTIKADDVTLQIKSNDKIHQRSISSQRRIIKASGAKGQKLGEIVTAEESNSHREKEADDAEIDNLSLNDGVRYSTVHLDLYQKVQTRYWVTANDNQTGFRPSIFMRLWDAMKSGWYILEEIIVFFMRLWFLFVIAAIVYLIYRKYKIRTATLSQQRILKR